MKMKSTLLIIFIIVLSVIAIMLYKGVQSEPNAFDKSKTPTAAILDIFDEVDKRMEEKKELLENQEAL